MTMILKHPVKVGELTVTEISLKRPKTKDFIALGTLPYDCAEADARLLASVSGLPESVIAQLDIEDWARLRIDLARIWESYFTGKAYQENPTGEEQVTAPQKDTA
ncbi:MAG: phage tail assembly protein [Treponema sp.]|jgi:hypothetical protein|nr:phage tail assembly protein [Treponema sp.]